MLIEVQICCNPRRTESGDHENGENNDSVDCWLPLKSCVGECSSLYCCMSKSTEVWKGLWWWTTHDLSKTPVKDAFISCQRDFDFMLPALNVQHFSTQACTLRVCRVALLGAFQNASSDMLLQIIYRVFYLWNRDRKAAGKCCRMKRIFWEIFDKHVHQLWKRYAKLMQKGRLIPHTEGNKVYLVYLYSCAAQEGLVSLLTLFVHTQDKSWIQKKKDSRDRQRKGELPGMEMRTEECTVCGCLYDLS